jgi:hypothetical protein
MSIFELSHITNVFGIFGLLQVVSLLGLLLLLLKSAQYYLHRQWLIKSLQQFPPAPPPQWLFGNTLKVRRHNLLYDDHVISEDYSV